MITYTDMKRRNTELGHHWFSKETMDYFGTLLWGYPTVLSLKPAIALFVSSEEDSTGIVWSGERRFTVRRYFDGEVSTVGELGQYPTREAAEQAIEETTRRIYEQGIPSWATMLGLPTEETTQK